MIVTDVGAAPIGDRPDVYAALLDLPGTRLVCFEPNPERSAQVRAAHPDACVIEAAVADGTRRSFYESGLTSSLYEPNPRTTTDLYMAGSQMVTTAVTTLDTVRLDDVREADGTDFLKLDAQGAEYDILANAPNLLAHCLAVHTEIEFYPLYSGQPLGWEVWAVLDRAGFDLYWFDHLEAYRMRSCADPATLTARRLGWGDAVFFPKPRRLATLDRDRVDKLSTIWRHVYHADDHCHWLAELHREVR